MRAAPSVTAPPDPGVGNALTRNDAKETVIGLPHLVAAVAVLLPAHHYKHHRECHEPRCARHADVLYARKHRPKFAMTSFEVCDANMESGAPEDPYNPAHIDWRMENGGYEGAFSWLPSTWQRQRPPGYPSRAVDASPREQVLVFRRYKNPGEWPTMAKC